MPSIHALLTGNFFIFVFCSAVRPLVFCAPICDVELLFFSYCAMHRLVFRTPIGGIFLADPMPNVHRPAPEKGVGLKMRETTVAPNTQTLAGIVS